jgi:hypothetical protein
MATVEIAPALASAMPVMARTLAGGGAVSFLLVADGDVAATERVLLAVVGQVQEAYAEAGDASHELDPPDAGEWNWTVTHAGIRLAVRKSNAFPEILASVATALGDGGVSGTFVVPAPERVVEPPWIAPMLSCRMRVAGHRADGIWVVDRGALEAVLAAATTWWRAIPTQADRSLGVADVGWEPVRDEAGVQQRLLAEVVGREGPGARVRAVAVGGSSFRAVTASADGAVTLTAGVDTAHEHGWREPLGVLIDFLRALAPRLVYARVLRGWDVRGALADETLSPDWPVNPSAPPPRDRAPFEDVRVPDAFGVQLLGGPYEHRLPTFVSDWNPEPTGSGTTLLAHTDLAGWFAAPFVPEGRRLPPEGRPVPTLLAEARGQLLTLIAGD